MQDSTVVAVFPSAFARGRRSLLASAIRAALASRGLRSGGVSADGDLILVEADDPVFASSAVSSLFGVERVMIARRAGAQLGELVDAVSETASRLMLAGERFVVSVTGQPEGYAPRDAEIAATSAILKAATAGASPGTPARHDREIRAHVSRTHSYVSIFTDEGPGGAPFGANKGAVACPVFDELSAVAALGVLEQGYAVDPVALYVRDSDLRSAARAVCRLARSTPSASIEAAFVRLSGSRNALVAAPLVAASIEAAVARAKSARLARVCLPLSPLVHPQRLIDEMSEAITGASLRIVEPLGTLSDVAERARAVGIEDMHGALDRLCRAKYAAGARSLPASPAKRITVRVGPNMLHDALDELADPEDAGGD